MNAVIIEIENYYFVMNFRIWVIDNMKGKFQKHNNNYNTQPPFYGYYTGQPALASTLLVHSFTARMPLLVAASAFELGRRC